MVEQGKDTAIPENEAETVREDEEETTSELDEQDEAQVSEVEDGTSSSVEEIDSSPLQGKVNELTEKNNELVEEKKQLSDRILRLQAEFENYKRRTEKEKLAERKYKAQDFAIELLPIIDNFERALQTEVSDENKGFREGMEMIYQQLQTAFKSQGIEQIETVGQQFDPNIHHAVMQVEDDNEESNIVVEELQKGYMLKDKVIRPAMVKVNK